MAVGKKFYIVRRLTPTECARLQGFSDIWGNIEQLENLTNEEVTFWQSVYLTHQAIIGNKLKPKTTAQLVRWHNSLHTDSAEYKMWGNGMAKNNAQFFVHRAFEVIRQRKAGIPDDRINIDS